MRRLIPFIVAATAAFSFSAAVQAQEKTLNVYTYESFTSDWGPGPKVKAFEKTCGCKVNFVSVSDGVALLTRLKLEGPKSDADIALGLDTNLISEAKATGLFEPHGLDNAVAVKVPGNYSDDTFVPYDYGHFAVVYDTKALKNPPKSLKELVEGDPSQKIAIEDPRTSTPGLGLLLWVKSVYGDKAPEAWAKFRKRVLTVTPGWSEAYGLFTKGEVPMVLSYTTSPAYHMVEEKSDQYQAASFAEGHYIQIEVAGVLKGAHDKDLARQFLKFMVSPAFQDIIPTTNWMMPVTKTSTPLPDAFGKLVQPQKTFLMGSDEVAKNRKAWIDEWLTAMSMN